MTPRERLLAACACEPVDRPPVWLMRQAGRYLPEYRAVREKAGGFLALAKTPELAAEVSIQPVRRFGMDAAIIFSDILIAPEAMGAEVAFEAGEGPRVRADLERLDAAPEPRERCAFLYDALRIVRKELPERALLGFAGAPFTVACYLVEGETSKAFERAKAWMFRDPDRARGLLERIAGFTARYLAAQVEAGADAVQLFDTWAHLLGPDDRARLAHEAAGRTIDLLRETGCEAPVIYYGGPCAKGWSKPDVFSVDWRADLRSERRAHRCVQGNLDPAVLLAGAGVTRERTTLMLEAAGTRTPGYIANLGHGVHKDTPIESVETFVEAVRSWKG